MMMNEYTVHQLPAFTDYRVDYAYSLWLKASDMDELGKVAVAQCLRTKALRILDLACVE
jgi:hypothetical protein